MSQPGQRLRLAKPLPPNANEKKRAGPVWNRASFGANSRDKTRAVDAASLMAVWQPPDLLLRLSNTGRNPARVPRLHDPTETEGSAGTLQVGNHEIHVPYLPKFI